MADERRGMLHVDLAQWLLHSGEANSPVLAERELADKRGKWFLRAVVALAASLVGMTALVLQAVVQVGGGEMGNEPKNTEVQTIPPKEPYVVFTPHADVVTKGGDAKGLENRVK